MKFEFSQYCVPPDENVVMDASIYRKVPSVGSVVCSISLFGTTRTGAPTVTLIRGVTTVQEPYSYEPLSVPLLQVRCSERHSAAEEETYAVTELPLAMVCPLN
jgi:hypothetical protein